VSTVVLGVAGGIASFDQILDGVVQVIGLVSDKRHSFKEAPSELHQIRTKLSSLQALHVHTESYLIGFPDAEILPADMS
jgi:hypothetical protein